MKKDLIFGIIIKPKFLNGTFIVKTNQKIIKHNLMNQKLFIHLKQQVKIYNTADVIQVTPMTLQIKLEELNSINDIQDFIGCKVGSLTQAITLSPTNTKNIYQNYEVWHGKNLVGNVATISNFGSANVIRVIRTNNKPDLLIPEINDYIKQIDEQEQKIILKKLPEIT